MINWKVRIKNRVWIMSFLSQVMLILQVLLSGLNSMGFTEFQLTEEIQGSVYTIVNVIFIILSMLGLVQDPTTKGYSDSVRAMKYKNPN